MAKKRVFVSFDFDNDRRYKYLLEAWDANPDIEFTFNDVTPSEIDTNDIGRIKAAITTKINTATHTLIIIGSQANRLHKYSSQIGYKNWINFEIHQSKLNRNRLVAVKLAVSNELPDELVGAQVSWAMSFTQDAITRALNSA
jgi:hypothetical protein